MGRVRQGGGSEGGARGQSGASIEPAALSVPSPSRAKLPPSLHPPFRPVQVRVWLVLQDRASGEVGRLGAVLARARRRRRGGRLSAAG